MKEKIEVHCECCGNTAGFSVLQNMTSVYSEKPFEIAECINCTNLITLPVIAEAELDKIYSESYLYDVHLEVLDEKRYRAKKLAKYIHKNNGNGKKILEIGCMYGYLLDELKNQNTVKGIEIGEDAVNYCLNKGLDVLKMSAEDYFSSAPEKFDIIILSHVFEHLRHPAEALRQISTRLEKNGMVYMSVPNSASICRKLFGRFWGWWQVPVHINHFNEKALASIANSQDFILDDVRFKGGDSLMWLLNFMNLFRAAKKKNKKISLLQKIIIRVNSMIVRYWYEVGNEELTVVLKVRAN
jgi:2-polyprenyl-3-methyl-5-hydroxy-6-metoxy-1,4-benzoquinol methylase